MSDLDIQKTQDAKEIDIEGATVPFSQYVIEGITYIEFDSSKCPPPEPMINAMLAMELIKDANTKVIMINHKSPAGLLAKIGENFDIQERELDDGRVKLVFSYKAGLSENADLSDKSCNG
ncbi:MAG: hypothetical protein R3331_11410 [Sulfurospirillaceae bacterium]|nr:hypothetical protein [Sulfurospirillaceae bacterium]